MEIVFGSRELCRFSPSWMVSSRIRLIYFFIWSSITETHEFEKLLSRVAVAALSAQREMHNIPLNNS